MSRTRRAPWMERTTRPELTAKIIILTMVVIAVVYPFWTVLATSLEGATGRGSGLVLLFPAEPSLQAYQTVLQIPEDLINSAKVDGAGEFRVLIRVVLPLSKAVIAVVSLFYAVAYWNSWFPALLYLSDNDMWPLQLVLRVYLLQGASLPGQLFDQFGGAPPPAQSVQSAVVMMATIPILLVYPFLQKYLSAGVLSGAIKG